MKTSLPAYWRKVASGTASDPWSSLLRGFLVPVSLVYALVLRIRSGLFRTGLLRSFTLPRPVISIGNISVGGTGKTPFTAHIARLIMAMGLKVAVLSRGYGGTLEGQTAIVSNGREITLSADQCGDEPFLLATSVPGLAVVIGTDRFAAGQLALQACSPDIFLLDDGFQHLRLHRDLNILLLDCTRPFGNGWTLPAGLLREPARSVARADLVVYSRCGDASAPAQMVTGKPYCLARHQLSDVVPFAGGDAYPLATLHDSKVVAFAGIAEPDAFFEELRTSGLDVAATLAFPDHAVYDRGRCLLIEATSRSCGAEYVITTEKDGVKLKHLPPYLSEKILLARLELFINDQSPLDSLLCNLLQK